MLKIFNLLKDDYPSIVNNLVVKIIQKDINYTIESINNPSFDIWEEKWGYHFYTRLVQLKFIKDYLETKNRFDKVFGVNQSIYELYEKFKLTVQDHLKENSIISSFEENGNVLRYDDASVLLAFCHIDFDEEILKYIKIKFVEKTIIKLLDYYIKKYDNRSLLLIGRYENDAWQGGHTWIICSLALAQLWKYFKNDTYKTIIKNILFIDKNLNISEQYDPNNCEQISSEKLTWNYSELYFTLL